MSSRSSSPPSPFDFNAPQCRLPDDAHTLKKGNGVRQDQFGTQALKFDGRGHQGTIVDRNPDTHTYTVAVSTGDGISNKESVGRITQSPGDIQMLPIGARVALSTEFGEMFIVGIIPYTSGRDDNENRLNLTGVAGTGGEDPLYSGRDSSANYRTKNTPRDMGGNDWAQVGEEGNAIAVLGGGVNVIRSSGMSQIRTHLLNDLVEVISRNFRHISDMGKSEIKNDNGQITWSFRGGSDQFTQTGSDEENWTIRIDLGAEGDLFRFELTQADGGTNFKFHVDPDGQLTVFSAEGSDEFVGGDKNVKILGDRETVVKGGDDQTIHGSQSKTIQGNRDTVVSGSAAKNVGNDETQSIQRHLTQTIGGKHEEKVVGGNPLTAKPGDVARETTINNGSWEVDIGNPLSGANPAALAGFLLNAFSGDIEMAVKTLGNVSFKTKAGTATLETLLGNASLKTTVGIANVDGTTVNLGPIAASFINPVIKGTVHTTAIGAYTAANMAALTPAIAATAALLGVVGGLGPILWPVGPIMAPAFAAWAAAINAALAALMASNAALAAALPATLSTKSFTA